MVIVIPITQATIDTRGEQREMEGEKSERYFKNHYESCFSNCSIYSNNNVNFENQKELFNVRRLK